jgi:hypothetical protein
MSRRDAASCGDRSDIQRSGLGPCSSVRFVRPQPIRQQSVADDGDPHLSARVDSWLRFRRLDEEDVASAPVPWISVPGWKVERLAKRKDDDSCFYIRRAKPAGPPHRRSDRDDLYRRSWAMRPGITPSRTIARSRRTSPADRNRFAGTTNCGSAGNFGGAGNAFGLLPLGIPPSTQSVTSEICSWVSPVSFRKSPETLDRAPGWHLSRQHCGLDGDSPGLGVLIRHQRKESPPGRWQDAHRW